MIERGAYGWAEFVAHRYCDGEAELARFYRGLGHWLGVLRLLGGTDIHHENLIAVGPVPVVIDVESLFAVIPSMRRPTGRPGCISRRNPATTSSSSTGCCRVWKGRSCCIGCVRRRVPKFRSSC